MYKLISGIIIFSLIVGGSVAYADDTAATLTDNNLTTIRRNCVSVQSTLNRIHESDALARVNLGQQYETIATKLMAPFNSRVALNRLDGVALTQTTVAFNNQLDKFRTLYRQYEQTLLKAMQLRCTDQPVTFYDTLNLARSQRAAVRDAITEMSKLVNQYSDQVKTLAPSVKEAQR
jgi:hypothetical protein